MAGHEVVLLDLPPDRIDRLARGHHLRATAREAAAWLQINRRRHIAGEDFVFALALLGRNSILGIGRWDHDCLFKAAPVMALRVPRVVITSGSSATSINVPCARSSAASSWASNSAVLAIFTPTYP